MQHGGRVNLHRPRCFLAVVDTGTVTAAARQLLIAQPALSRQVQLLAPAVRAR
jgi:DNA-binding transcriptional LysR family regulator